MYIKWSVKTSGEIHSAEAVCRGETETLVLVRVTPAVRDTNFFAEFLPFAERIAREVHTSVASLYEVELQVVFPNPPWEEEFEEVIPRIVTHYDAIATGDWDNI